MSNQLSAPPPPKKPLLESAKDFIGSALGPLKGRDTNQLMEEFTSEMTLVAEGLSEDQTRLSGLVDSVSAQQTAFEQETLDKLHDLGVSIGETEEKLSDLQGRLQKLEKQLTDKKGRRLQGLTGVLTQATYLAAILAGAWIITTLIDLFK